MGLDSFRFCTGLAWLSQHVLGSCLEGNVTCVFTRPIKTCSSQSTLYVLMRFSFNIKGGIGYGLIMLSRVVSCQAQFPLAFSSDLCFLGLCKMYFIILDLCLGRLIYMIYDSDIFHVLFAYGCMCMISIYLMFLYKYHCIF